MHFVKAVILFAGIAAAAPATTTTPASSAKTPTASQVSVIKNDLTAFDNSMTSAISALNAFTGGTKINDQAAAVTTAGDAWQAATVKLLQDAQGLEGYTQFTTTDSSAITKLITGNIQTDATKLFKLITDKKSLFKQIGAVQNVHDGLVGILSEVGQVGQALQPHLQSADLKTLQTAGTAIVDAANAAINSYAS